MNIHQICTKKSLSVNRLKLIIRLEFAKKKIANSSTLLTFPIFNIERHLKGCFHALSCLSNYFMPRNAFFGGGLSSAKHFPVAHQLIVIVFTSRVSNPFQFTFSPSHCLSYVSDRASSFFIHLAGCYCLF